MNLKKNLQSLIENGMQYSSQLSLFQSRLYEKFNLIVELAQIEQALEEMWIEQQFEYEQQIKYHLCIQTENLLLQQCANTA